MASGLNEQHLWCANDPENTTPSPGKHRIDASGSMNDDGYSYRGIGAGVDLTSDPPHPEAFEKHSEEEILLDTSPGSVGHPLSLGSQSDAAVALVNAPWHPNLEYSVYSGNAPWHPNLRYSVYPGNASLDPWPAANPMVRSLTDPAGSGINMVDASSILGGRACSLNTNMLGQELEPVNSYRYYGYSAALTPLSPSSMYWPAETASTTSYVTSDICPDRNGDPKRYGPQPQEQDFPRASNPYNFGSQLDGGVLMSHQNSGSSLHGGSSNWHVMDNGWDGQSFASGLSQYPSQEGCAGMTVGFGSHDVNSARSGCIATPQQHALPYGQFHTPRAANPAQTQGQLSALPPSDAPPSFHRPLFQPATKQPPSYPPLRQQSATRPSRRSRKRQPLPASANIGTHSTSLADEKSYLQPSVPQGERGRGRRTRSMTDAERKDALAKRQDKSVCICCNKKKTKCKPSEDSDSCKHCAEAPSRRIHPCVRANFYEFVEIAPTEFEGQHIINYPRKGSLERRCLNMPSTIDFPALVANINKVHRDFDVIEVSCGSRKLFDMRMSAYHSYLTSTRANTQSEYPLRRFIDHDLREKRDRWERAQCVDYAYGSPNTLDRAIMCNEMLSRQTFTLVSSTAGTQKSLDPDDDEDRQIIYDSAVLSRIASRQLEIVAYKGLKKTLEDSQPRMTPEYFRSFGRLVCHLRWQISRLKLQRSVLPQGHRGFDDLGSFLARITKLCRVLYFHYLWLTTEDSCYVNMQPDDMDDGTLPKESSTEGFEKWMREGEDEFLDCSSV